MLITKIVEVTLHANNIKYYENLGYKIPRYLSSNRRNCVKIGTKLNVKVEDLSDGSNILVDIKCDGCGEILIGVKWSVYKRYVNEDGEYYCQKCAVAGHKKWVNFEQWCYDNLSNKDAENILLRWDYEKNKLSPKDISFGSAGFNKKGYWFKCLEHPEHGSEQKSILHFTRGDGGNLSCSKCNCISITHPNLVSYFVNKEDTIKYSIGTHTNVSMKCPNCGYEKDMKIHNLMNRGFSCPKCGDKISYPEKFMFNVLEQLGIEFQPQLTKTTFKWCKEYKYDFYIPSINGIIETHGIQHYEEKAAWGGLIKVHDNDKCKEKVANEHGIINYIILDCRISDMEWIKNSIINSNLPQILKFKENDIDWLMCHEYACSSLVKTSSDLWNVGMRNTSKIANLLKVGKGTIANYLKQGFILGWSDYNSEDAMKMNYNSLQERMSVKVVCLTTGEIFNSQTDGAKKYNITKSGISQCCNNKQKSAGKDLETGEKLTWMHYDKWIAM